MNGSIAASPRPFVRSGAEPQIEMIIPVVRWADLVRHLPRLKREIVPSAFVAFEQAWPFWKEQYRNTIKEMTSAVGIRADRFEIDSNERLRLRDEGKTPMIDLPRIRAFDRDVCVFDVRLCIALCLDEFSSKVWSRIGPPHDRNAGCLARELDDVLKQYRTFAKRCSQWFNGEFFRITAHALDGHERSDSGALEVVTLGLRVSEGLDEEDFKTWLFNRDGGPNLKQAELRRFLKIGAGLEYEVDELKLKEPAAFWMSLPMAIQLENGDLASRTALYFVRPVDDRLMQVVGIGFDDSRKRDFASEVALKLSRVIANRI